MQDIHEQGYASERDQWPAGRLEALP
jgi:hypothetical protein